MVMALQMMMPAPDTKNSSLVYIKNLSLYITGKHTVIPPSMQYPAIWMSSFRRDISLSICDVEDRLMLPAYWYRNPNAMYSQNRTLTGTQSLYISSCLVLMTVFVE